ncbi:TrgA family protein [Pseudaestuariivita atlantica]|uniref:Tellurium resistance protein n=1 Tax=Pseudaestuariivita atlantica TaxID=1317121 RepID=A0A0L1JVR1_9RHOB|nr:TrgA family protein [Pseudaestuariivita atlantica]KNG95458.1 tellurium resistance protein [Pseudaestuariivita atlantica]
MFPTAAKLVAAVCLGALGWYVSELIKPLVTEAKVITAFGWFSVVNAVIGAIVGWVFIGSRAGGGMSAAIGIGITGMALMVLWGLGLQGANEMIALAMKNRYDGPVEAVTAVFELSIEYFFLMSTVEIWMTLIVGGIVSGIAAEFAARRWR